MAFDEFKVPLSVRVEPVLAGLMLVKLVLIAVKDASCVGEGGMESDDWIEMLESVSNAEVTVLELSVVAVPVSETLARLVDVGVWEFVTGAESVTVVEIKEMVAVEDVEISKVSGSSDVVEGEKMAFELVPITLAVDSTVEDGLGVKMDGSESDCIKSPDFVVAVDDVSSLAVSRGDVVVPWAEDDDDTSVEVLVSAALEVAVENPETEVLVLSNPVLVGKAAQFGCATTRSLIKVTAPYIA